MVLRTKPTASCLLSKHSTNWAAPPGSEIPFGMEKKAQNRRGEQGPVEHQETHDAMLQHDYL